MTRPPTRPASPLQPVVDAARAGDEDAFRRLVDDHRRELHVHCYRMLGSLHDADDALQEVMLRAWRALPGLQSTEWLRAWLYKIATNVCLNAIAGRSRRMLPADLGPPADPALDPGAPRAATMWIEPYPDERGGIAAGDAAPDARYEQREAVELAFVAALQHLPARQRAVLILRDVLGFSAREVAAVLDVTVASVNSAMQRARRTLDERLPGESQQRVVRRLGDDRTRELAARFADAFEQGDVEQIVALLVEDATFTMPPYAAWYRGRRAVAASWLAPVGPPQRLRAVATRASGQPALAVYELDPVQGEYVPLALDVLTLRDGSIAEVTAFRTPGLFPSFGLPDRLPA